MNEAAEQRPPCPFLPEGKEGMNWRDLRVDRSQGDTSFILAASSYAQQLWIHYQTARSLLALGRALYAQYPPEAEAGLYPYRAFRWILSMHRGEDFLGNPRISFHHQASRYRGDNAELRNTRAWLVWHLVRQQRPELPADQRSGEKAPSISELIGFIESLGFHSEAKSFLHAWEDGQFPSFRIQDSPRPTPPE